jgi:GTP-binding protein EngB required for normal cell division
MPQPPPSPAKHTPQPAPPPPPPPPPPSSACVLLIIGECGDGKSTLVNALRDPARSEGAKAGLATRGVTKEISVFEGKPIKGRAIQIMDTPGIGDQDVTPLSLVAMIEAKLSDHPIPISGVIVTTPATEGRIKLGAQVVQTLVEHGFIGEHKWDSIILVGTKSDRANEVEKAFFRDSVVKDFFGKAPPGTSPKFALTTKEDVSQLVTQIGSLPGVPIEYRQPETASLAQIFAAKFGIPVEAFSTAFDQIRDQLANQAMAEIEKERRQIEQLRQEQAAAEAKGKAEAAELARQLVALQEQLKLQQERIVRARPSTLTSVVNGTWNGITYLPLLVRKQFA